MELIVLLVFGVLLLVVVGAALVLLWRMMAPLEAIKQRLDLIVVQLSNDSDDRGPFV